MRIHENSMQSLQQEESISKVHISSNRFFFTPTSTKSLMEDFNTRMGFLKTSLKMAMASRDPHRDFKGSMEEMVEAYSIGEMRGLQELLHCYLRLNERKNHKIIASAFRDLLLDLVAQKKITMV